MGKYDGLVKYDKLIRDKILDILDTSNVKHKSHIADGEEYWDKLVLKLSEEVKEFLEEPCIKELSDIQEVVNAIADFKFGGAEELEKIRKERADKRGGFSKRIILEETDNR